MNLNNFKSIIFIYLLRKLICSCYEDFAAKAVDHFYKHVFLEKRTVNVTDNTLEIVKPTPFTLITQIKK
jgi:hypothetical protein